MDIIEKIKQKNRENRIGSPLACLFRETEKEEKVESVDQKEEPTELLNITHLGETPIEDLASPEKKEIIELNTANPNKIRYLKLIMALLESSNYDEAISAIMELAEGSGSSESG